jgi:hypothetical protein
MMLSGPNSSITDDNVGVVLPGAGLAVGDVVELKHPVPLGLVVRAVGLLEGLYGLK